MGVSMDFLMNLIQLGLDAGILALCCEVVFRQKAEIKAKDFFVFPIFLESFRMVPPRFCAENGFLYWRKYDGIFPQ